MVGNFREGFIFTFLASQEPFVKIKIFNLATSNYLSVLTATEACQ